MKKKVIRKAFLSLALFAVVVMSTFAFVACKKPTNYSITWELTNATVEVTNYSTAPSSVESGTEVKFSVVPTAGYKLNSNSVKINGVTASATEGIYSFTVTVDTTVVVLAERELTSVVVKTNPTKMTYFAGDSLDRTGMVVEANYATGEKEEVDVKSTLLTVTPAVFEGGNESFTVSFGGKTSEAVSLDKVVENLVTIETRIAFTTEQLKLFSDYNNYNVSDKNTVTFSYLDNLPKDGLNIPAIGDTEDYTFMGFRTIGSDGKVVGAIDTIKNDTKSVVIKAAWEANLAYIYEVALSDNDGKAVLRIKGELRADDVALYFYEGNDEVDLDGGKIPGKKGDSFDYEFDLKKLADKGYDGKWMDIRLVSTTDKTAQMNIYPNDYVMLVDNGQTAQSNDGNGYYFLTHSQFDYVSLKIVHKPIKYTYSANFVDDGDTTKLVLEGKFLDSELFGNTVRVSWDQDGAGKFPAESLIDANGNWKLSLDLKQIKAGNNVWAHIVVVDSEGEEVMPREDLAIAACETSMPALWPIGEIERGIMFESTRSFTYYLGHRGWDANKLFVVDNRYAIENITLEEDDGEAFLIISGRTLVDDNTVAYLESLVLDLAHVEGDWARNEYDKKFLTIDKEKEKFSYRVNLSELKDLGNYFFHWGVGTGNESNLLYTNMSGSIRVGDLVYTLVPNYENWWAASAVMISEMSAEATSIELMEKDGKVYVVVEGTYNKDAKEVLEKDDFFDLQYFENGWKVFHFEDAITINDDGTFVIKADISKMTAHKFTVHLFGGAPDGNLYVEGASGVVELGDRTFTLKSTTSNPWGDDWSTACIEITEAPLEVTSLELKEIDGKVHIVVNGNLPEGFSGSVEDRFVFDLMHVGQWWTNEFKVVSVNIEAGTFQLLADISKLVKGNTFALHVNGGDIKLEDLSSVLTIGDTTYRISERTVTPWGEDWATAGLMIYDAKSIETDSLELKEDEGKVYLVLKGTYTVNAETTLALQNNEVVDLEFMNPDGEWPKRFYGDKVVLNADTGTFVITIEITDKEQGKHIIHFNGDVLVPGCNTSITVDGVTYRVNPVTANPWGDPWGTASFDVVGA